MSIVSVLVIISLLGLIGVQVFWVKNAISLKEEEFNRSVNDALNSVVYKLEKTATAAKIRKNIKFKKQGIRYYPADYNYNKTLSSDTFKNKINQVFDRDRVNVRILEEMTTDSNGIITTSYNQKTYKGDSMANKEFPYPMEYNSGGDAEKIKMELLQQRTEMVNDLFEELISINIYKDYKPKVDTALMDSLLTDELNRQGVTARYLYSVKSDASGSLRDFSKAIRECDTSGCYFKVNLAPNNTFIKPLYLSLYFPNQQNYLLRTLWVTLIVSGLIILILIASFYYTITTIQRQKKLSLIKNDFISNMTHEFKTPISTISLASEMLNDQSVSKTPEKVERFVKMIKDENKRLSVLVESILQTAILDKGEFKLKKSDIDLHEIIKQAIQNIQIQIDQKGGQIHSHLNAERCILHADKVHITNIVFNLIDNAIKYSKEVPKITVETSNVRSGILFVVKDRGVGISKENLKKIFEKFYRVPTGNVHNIKGFGLGLSYVQAIAVKHGGEISVESELNKGSTFKVYLPFRSE
ncbi:MAG: sensor histidine kinase [Bacteroidia bacterium]